MLPFENALPFEDELPFEKEKSVDEMKAPKWARTAAGLPEAGLSMLSGLPAQIAGGLGGLSAGIYHGLKTGDVAQGIDAGSEVSKAIQESNFGFGQFNGITDVGKQATQTVGELMAKPGQYAGKGAEALGLDPIYGQLPVDAAMNFLPLHLGVTVPMKGIGKVLAPKEAKVPITERLKPEPVKPTETLPFETGDLRLESPIAADIRVQQQNRKLNTAEDFNNRDANVRAVEEEIAAKEAADAYESRLAAHEAEQARLAELENWRNNAKQDSIVEDFGNNDPLTRMPEMRIDENGIPIRADLSMEAQNLQNPLQRNLWGDELPIRTGDNGIPLTQAIDKMPPGELRDQAINQISGNKFNQRGAIDLSIFDDSYDRYKKLSDNLVLRFRGGSEPTVYAIDMSDSQNPQVISHARFSRDMYYKDPAVTDNLQPKWVHTIPERQKQGIAKEMYKFVAEQGNDIIPDDVQTPYGRKLWDSLNKDGLVQNKKINAQRGVLNIKDIADAVSKSLSKVGTKLGDVLTPKERLIVDNLGNHDYIPRGDDPANIIQKALTEQDGPNLFDNMQSGLDVAAKKANSTLMQGVSRWLAWAEKSSNKYFRDQVQPMERAYKDLNVSELADLNDLMKSEMFDRQRYTPEQLRAAGLSDKGIKSYTQLRDTFEHALQTINEARLTLGQKPITPAEAYLSSQWRGNWHMPVRDADGKLVWYIKTESRGEATKAKEWFAKNHPEYKVSNVEYRPSDTAFNVPKDVTDIYSRMLETFEGTPIADEISMLMNQYKQERDFTAGNFKVHFENKSNVRGFLGDRPWLSEKENARQGAKAQIAYLKDAYRWAPMNEALGNIKEVLNNPELTVAQPNNIGMAKLYTANAMGITNNMFKGFENYIAKNVGQSPTTFRQFIGDLKSWTYLTQLGLSTGYAIATPAQALVLGPALHLKLSGDGYKHNPIVSMVKSTLDTAKILATHESYTLTKQLKDYKLSPLGKEALRYAEDNGIVSVSLFDENADLGAHPVTQGVKDILGFTISLPEKIARTSTFMSFVHHLDASGKFKGDNLAMFRYAEELTDQTLTKFSRSGRPLIADRMGMLGELGYTYKSPIFNYYNNLAALAYDGKRTGNYKPLLAALGMTIAMGGVLNTPGLQELDSAFGMFKDAVAKHMPQYTKDLEALSPKAIIVSNLPDVMSYGAVSAATGTQMATRFSTQVMDPANPMGDIFPAAGTIGNIASAGKIALNPNETTFAQAAYNNAPPIGKGLLETGMDTFKTGPRGETQGYYNPNRLEERDKSYDRKPADERARKLGLTSLEEAKAKDIRFANSKENKRFDTARKASMTKMFDAIVRGDKKDVDKYAEAYFNNYGDNQSFKTDFNRALEGSSYTPEQKELLKANTVREIESILRRFKLEGK